MKLNKIITIISVQMSPFQKFDHKLIFVILIRCINTKLLKSCSKNQKLHEVAKFGKSCSKRQKLLKIAEHNLSGPSRGMWGQSLTFIGLINRSIFRRLVTLKKIDNKSLLVFEELCSLTN